MRIDYRYYSEWTSCIQFGPFGQTYFFIRSIRVVTYVPSLRRPLASSIDVAFWISEGFVSVVGIGRPVFSSQHPLFTIKMIFAKVILSIAALAVSTTNAFVQHQPLGVSRTITKSSSLNMVADDAKVVLVTGSSRGLGKAIALDFGKQGQKVVVNYVSDGSAGAAAATVDAIKAAGGDAIAVQADSE